MTVVGIDTAVLFVGLGGVLAAVVLGLLLLSPWKAVRDEPPLDEDVETRLLLGEDPDAIAADVDAAAAAEARQPHVHDLEVEVEVEPAADDR